MKSLGLKLMWVSLGPVLGVVGLAVLVMLTVWQRKLSAALEQRRHRRALRKQEHFALSSRLRALEELHGPLVPLGGLARPERAEVAPPPGLRILLPRVQPPPPRFELPDHFADQS